MVAKINLEIITNRLNLRVSDLCKLFQSIEGNIIPNNLSIQLLIS